MPALRVEGGRDPGGVRDMQPRDDRRARARAAKPEAATGTKPARGLDDDHGTDPRRPERARREVRTMIVRVWTRILTYQGDPCSLGRPEDVDLPSAPHVGDSMPERAGCFKGIVRHREWTRPAGPDEPWMLEIFVEARLRPDPEVAP